MVCGRASALRALCCALCAALCALPRAVAYYSGNKRCSSALEHNPAAGSSLLKLERIGARGEALDSAAPLTLVAGREATVRWKVLYEDVRRGQAAGDAVWRTVRGAL